MTDIRKPKLLEANVVIGMESLAKLSPYPHDLAYKHESDLVANLARQAHAEGLRFTGWPEVFVYREDATFSTRINATVWAVPR